MPEHVLTELRRLARESAGNAYVPYSGKAMGAVALLSDGSWIPGVRVENASFPLVIPALSAALFIARCAGRTDLVGIAQSDSFSEPDALFVGGALSERWLHSGPDILRKSMESNLPEPTNRLDIYLNGDDSEEGLLALANDVSKRAHIPESGFPVGCVLRTDDGKLIPGCNVEYSDWTKGLCAERIALATALSYGHRSFDSLYLSCPKEPGCSPCGACRQVLFELAPSLSISMNRGSRPAEKTTPEQLLPGGFRGEVLRG